MGMVARNWPRVIAASGVLWLLALGAIAAHAADPASDPRVVRGDTRVDSNGDLSHDLLEQHLNAGTFRRFAFQGMSPSAASQTADLIVCLDHAPTAADAAIVAQSGGMVAWTMGALPDDLIYAMRVGWPVQSGATALSQLKSALPGITWIDETPTPEATMYYSSKQSGTRRAWVTTGFRGRSDRTVVIMDTGLDDTHSDIAGRIVGWTDVTVSAAPTPRDPIHHGSHVAGTAVGNGTAAGIASGTGQIYIASTANFNTAAGFGPVITFPVDTTGYGAPAPIQVHLRWANTGGSGNVNLFLGRWDGANFTTTASTSAAMSAAQPLILSSTIPAGEARPDWAVLITRDVSGDTTKFWVQRRSPFTSAGDGFTLNSGLAPESSLAGVRIFDDSGSGSGDVLVGFQWIMDNRVALGIVAVCNSWTFTNSVIPSVDAAVNNLVAGGVVIEGSAGNGRGGGTDKVASPASASAAIATAALSALDEVTYYSSFGSTGLGQSKPDIAAPGGSVVALPGFGAGRVITSIDSNDADEANVAPDQFADDYRGLQGTSMAGPHAAGAAALIAQALESFRGTWTWSDGSFSNRVKMIMGMTATETNIAAQATPDPTLDRGAKDISEGFGRMNVDAAVETVAFEYTLGTTVGTAFGSNPFDRKAWGRHVFLTGSIAQSFTLTVPGGADYDLYLYRDTWTNDATTSGGSIGDPIIAVKSTTATLGGTESFSFTPTTTGLYYLVVKRVSGSGSFSLDSSPPAFTCGGPMQATLTGMVARSSRPMPARVSAAMLIQLLSILPPRQCGG